MFPWFNSYWDFYNVVFLGHNVSFPSNLLASWRAKIAGDILGFLSLYREQKRGTIDQEDLMWISVNDDNLAFSCDLRALNDSV